MLKNQMYICHGYHTLATDALQSVMSKMAGRVHTWHLIMWLMWQHLFRACHRLQRLVKQLQMDRQSGYERFRWGLFYPAIYVLPQYHSLSERISRRSTRLRCHLQILPLWKGGCFGSTYNKGRPVVQFTTPYGTRAALLITVITGHDTSRQIKPTARKHMEPRIKM